MKKKIEKNFVYEGLGFPVTLNHVEMVMIDDEWHPKIDVKAVAQMAMSAVVTQKDRLTGAQVKFIRTYFGMSLRQFAKIMDVSQTAVNKWEKAASKPSKMDIHIEKMLRLHIYDTVFMTKDTQLDDFYHKYQEINRLCP